jgi:D-alanine-D-alanine ligase
LAATAPAGIIAAVADEPRLRLGIILGGRSSEREVSLASGRQVYYNVDRSRYEPIALFMDSRGWLWRLPEKLVIQNTCPDIETRLTAEAERVRLDDLPALIDVAFIALHGKYGDDGCIQGVLELLDVPYTGSGVLPCAVSLDKPTAHALLGAAGFEVPRETVIHDDEWCRDPDGCTERIMATVGLPAVVLPAREGSSIGVSVVRQAADLPSALATAFEWDNRALVEEHLAGMEFSVILLGNDEVEAFLPTETRTTNPYMTYDDKYMPGRSQKITPAPVGAETVARIQEEATRVYRALGFRGYGRLDGFLLADGRILFTDPNSTSGMSPSSFMFHQAAEAGLTPMALIDRILTLAREAHAAKRGPL